MATKFLNKTEVIRLEPGDVEAALRDYFGIDGEFILKGFYDEQRQFLPGARVFAEFKREEDSTTNYPTAVRCANG